MRTYTRARIYRGVRAEHGAALLLNAELHARGGCVADFLGGRGVLLLRLIAISLSLLEV